MMSLRGETEDRDLLASLLATAEADGERAFLDKLQREVSQLEQMSQEKTALCSKLEKALVSRGTLSSSDLLLTDVDTGLSAEGVSGQKNGVSFVQDARNRLQLDAIQFSGISVTSLQPFIVRFTPYTWQYCEPYYLQLESDQGAARVKCHTLPPSVPVRLLEKTCLLEHRLIPEFITEVSVYVNNFIERRDQARLMQDMYHEELIQWYNTLDYCFLEFVVDINDQQTGNMKLIVSLAYDKRQCLPHQVELNTKGVKLNEEDMEELRKQCEVFRYKPLAMALKEALGLSLTSSRISVVSESSSE